MPKFIIRRIASDNREGSRRHALDLNAYTATPEDVSQEFSAKMEGREKTVKDKCVYFAVSDCGAAESAFVESADQRKMGELAELAGREMADLCAAVDPSGKKDLIRHYVISWKVEDGETPPPHPQMVEAALKLKKALDFENCPASLAIHANTKNPHIHLAVCRIDPVKGKIVTEASNSNRRWAVAIQKEMARLSVEYGWELPEGAKYKPAKGKSETTIVTDQISGEEREEEILAVEPVKRHHRRKPSEHYVEERTGMIGPQTSIAMKVEAFFRQHEKEMSDWTIGEVFKRLKQRGLPETKLTINESKNIFGLVYGDQVSHIKASGFGENGEYTVDGILRKMGRKPISDYPKSQRTEIRKQIYREIAEAVAQPDSQPEIVISQNDMPLDERVSKFFQREDLKGRDKTVFLRELAKAGIGVELNINDDKNIYGITYTDGQIKIPASKLDKKGAYGIDAWLAILGEQKISQAPKEKRAELRKRIYAEFEQAQKEAASPAWAPIPTERTLEEWRKLGYAPEEILEIQRISWNEAKDKISVPIPEKIPRQIKTTVDAVSMLIKFGMSKEDAFEEIAKNFFPEWYERAKQRLAREAAIKAEQEAEELLWRELREKNEREIAEHLARQQSQQILIEASFSCVVIAFHVSDVKVTNERTGRSLTIKMYSNDELLKTFSAARGKDKKAALAMARAVFECEKTGQAYFNLRQSEFANVNGKVFQKELARLRKLDIENRNNSESEYWRLRLKASRMTAREAVGLDRRLQHLEAYGDQPAIAALLAEDKDGAEKAYQKIIAAIKNSEEKLQSSPIKAPRWRIGHFGNLIVGDQKEKIERFGANPVERDDMHNIPWHEHIHAPKETPVNLPFC